MREIKFRAIVIDDDGNKRLEDNCWPVGDKVFVENGGFWMKFEKADQFTGTQDKNKKDIYESDIIRDNLGEFWEVVFEKGCFWLRRESYSTTNQAFSWPEHSYPMFRINHDLYTEVVGNKYKNGNLLQ